MNAELLTTIESKHQQKSPSKHNEIEQKNNDATKKARQLEIQDIEEESLKNDAKQAFKIANELTNTKDRKKIIQSIRKLIGEKRKQIIQTSDFTYTKNSILEEPEIALLLAPEYHFIKDYESPTHIQAEDGLENHFQYNSTLSEKITEFIQIINSDENEYHILDATTKDKVKILLAYMADNVYMSTAYIPKKLTAETLSEFFTVLKKHDDLLLLTDKTNTIEEPKIRKNNLEKFTLENKTERESLTNYVLQQLLLKINNKENTQKEKEKLQFIYSQGLEKINSSEGHVKDFMIISLYNSFKNEDDTETIWGRTWDFFSNDVNERKEQALSYIQRNKSGLLEKKALTNGKEIKTISSIESGLKNGRIPDNIFLGEYIKYLEKTSEEKNIQVLVDTIPHKAQDTLGNNLEVLKKTGFNSKVILQIQHAIINHKEAHKIIDKMIELLNVDNFEIESFMKNFPDTTALASAIITNSNEKLSKTNREGQEITNPNENSQKTIQIINELLVSDISEKKKAQLSKILNILQNPKENIKIHPVEHVAIWSAVSHVADLNKGVRQTFAELKIQDKIKMINHYQGNKTPEELREYLKNLKIEDETIDIILASDQLITKNLTTTLNLVNQKEGTTNRENALKKITNQTAISHLEIAQKYSRAKKRGIKIGERGYTFINNRKQYAENLLMLSREQGENSEIDSALSKYKKELIHNKSSLSKWEKELLKKMKKAEEERDETKKDFISRSSFENTTVITEEGGTYDFYSEDSRQVLISEKASQKGGYSTTFTSSDGTQIETKISEKEKNLITSQKSPDAIKNTFSYYEHFKKAGMHNMHQYKEAFIRASKEQAIPESGNMNRGALLKFSNYILQVIYGINSIESQNPTLTIAQNTFRKFSGHNTFMPKESFGINGYGKLTSLLKESGCIEKIIGVNSIKIDKFAQGEGILKFLKNTKENQ